MARIEGFNEDETAKELHTQGLSLIKTDIEGAHGLYNEALQRLSDVPHGLDEPSLRMQAARILRDDGFLHVRQAVRTEADKPEAEIDEGLKKLLTSEAFTRGLKDRKAPRFSPDAWRFVRSEHGATVALIARLATVTFVLETELSQPPIRYYEAAHADLSLGSNRYYETSNAISAARQAILGGSSYTASVWRDRAYKSSQRAKKEDPVNAKAAARTYNRRKKYLKSVRIARNSVRRDP